MSEPIVVSDLKALRKVVLAAIREHGPAVDLNHIDVGGVDKFDGLFKDTGFCGDVSGWNMAIAESTDEMFMNTPFNGDVSKWTMGNLKKANRMFKGSLFNGDVRQWGADQMIRLNQNESMFEGTPFSQDLTSWHIAHIRETFQLKTLSVFTKSDSLWAAISGGKPKPPEPTPANLRKTTVQTYAQLFGGEARLGEYLSRTPFGVMHFDACCVSETCPTGIAEEDFRWSRELFLVGTGLGLDNAGLRELCLGQLGMRAVGVEESFPLAGFLASSDK